ncbi:MAG: ribonuclease P protein component [Amoebophilaceae bacterium]|nr:ribonuclease P protein component [Amoebophilaceae bacterium]
MVTATKRFSKQDRLTNRKAIQKLFNEGNAFKKFPYRVFYLSVKKTNELFCNKVVFSVPKKHIRSAVQRNKIKRLCREVYRLNKHLLSDTFDAEFVFLIGFVYTDNCSAISYPYFNKAMVGALQYVKQIDPK